MRRRFAIVSLAFAWVCAQGAIWDTVQFVAWAKMFAGYAETMPVAAALSETFDPAKPCELCTSVAEAKKTDAAEDPMPALALDAVKIVLVLQPVEPPVFANDPGRWPAAPPAWRPSRTEPVDVPPPRV